MKNIKFRAWHKVSDRGWMARVIALLFGQKNMLVRTLQHDGPSALTRDYTSDEVQLMQWTRLTDRADVDIYEGDIVKLEFDYDNRKIKPFYEVIDEGYKWIIRAADGHCHDCEDMMYNMTVVGNIYANPEFLEVKE